jgi:hypothetical protein
VSEVDRRFWKRVFDESLVDLMNGLGLGIGEDTNRLSRSLANAGAGSVDAEAIAAEYLDRLRIWLTELCFRQESVLLTNLAPLVESRYTAIRDWAIAELSRRRASGKLGAVPDETDAIAVHSGEDELPSDIEDLDEYISLADAQSAMHGLVLRLWSADLPPRWTAEVVTVVLSGRCETREASALVAAEITDSAAGNHRAGPEALLDAMESTRQQLARHPELADCTWTEGNVRRVLREVFQAVRDTRGCGAT